MRVSHIVAVACTAIAALVVVTPTDAQPLPSPSPAPSASPTPRPGTIRTAIDASSVFISTGTSGPGRTPAEASSFIGGSPESPLTPYDTLTSAPLIPGNAGIAQLRITPTYALRTLDLSATFAAGYVSGSVTNAMYWGENLIPALNPHLGSSALPYAIVFPTHPGSDDARAFRASVLAGSIADRDGRFALRAGWFEPAQYDRFVFLPPALTSVTPALAPTTPETLGDGPPANAWWPSAPTSLPLQGVDARATVRGASFELADASLPSLVGTQARVRFGSVVLDRGEGTRFSGTFSRITTGGLPIGTTVLYGAQPQIQNTAQGSLPTSLVGGQRQTTLGLRAAFHAARALDAVVELGRSTYDADLVAAPGTNRPGNYVHVGVTHPVGGAHASFDLYRNEPRYAPILLPYGVQENVWSVAWSWPGQWLKSYYQSIDNAAVNINRQGYRLRGTYANGPLDVRAAFASFSQIEPITIANALQTGWIDGFFLPQATRNPTLGRQNQYLFYVLWHAKLADLSVDYNEDTMHRSAAPGAPLDAVSYDTPVAILTASRALSPRLLAAGGYGHYAMKGSFAQGGRTNVDYAQRTYFAGLQLLEGAHSGTMMTLRRTLFDGLAPQPQFGPPTFAGTQFILEQRLKL